MRENQKQAIPVTSKGFIVVFCFLWYSIYTNSRIEIKLQDIYGDLISYKPAVDWDWYSRCR